MKQKVLLTMLFALVLIVVSCDTLWSVKETTDITFEVSKDSLEELFSSDSMKNVSNMSSSTNSVLRSINFGDNGIEMTVSLHNVGDEGVIESKTLVVKQGETVSFDNLAIVGQTVYAKIVLTQNGITKEGLSESKTMVAGKNYLSIGNFTVKLVEISLKEIQGGTFEMGNADESISDTDDQRPVREVTVGSFYLGETEVTQAQWLAVMTEWPSEQPMTLEEGGYGKSDDHPAYYVNWYDAIQFCNALSAKEGLTAYYTIDKTVGSDDNNNSSSDTQKWKVEINSGANGYRLPTEAEWEYAAGGGASDRTIYAGTNNGETTGLEPLTDYAWYSENNNKNGNPYGSKAVGTRKPNALGLYDMSGNLWEWCWDWYDVDYYAESDNTDNPLGATSGSTRVRRGGFWVNNETIVRVAYRHGPTPNSRSYNLGFRVARNAE